jgi:L-rhamnose mutarotase
MKTQVTMIRKMGSFYVFQRTKDGMFNATELLKQWNVKTGAKKEVSKFFELEQTKQFLNVLLSKELSNTQDSAYLKTRGNKGSTWMHPFLFIKFGMWINPEFELDVIKFVYDQLIEYRELAGDLYKDLMRAVSKFSNVDYSHLARGLNYITFGRHEAGIRQHATREELARINDLQKKLAFAIDMGYINSFDELMSELRKLFHMNSYKLAQ